MELGGAWELVLAVGILAIVVLRWLLVAVLTLRLGDDRWRRRGAALERWMVLEPLWGPVIGKVGRQRTGMGAGTGTGTGTEAGTGERTGRR